MSAAYIQVHIRLDFIMEVDPVPANISLSWKYCLLFTFAACIQVHLILDFMMEANIVNLWEQGFS